MFVKFILKAKQNWNLKMLLLQNNRINNGVTNGLKKKKKHVKQLYIVKQKKGETWKVNGNLPHNAKQDEGAQGVY